MVQTKPLPSLKKVAGSINVLVDGVSYGAISSYTFYNVTQNHTISASFIVSQTTASADVVCSLVTTDPNTGYIWSDIYYELIQKFRHEQVSKAIPSKSKTT